MVAGGGEEGESPIQQWQQHQQQQWLQQQQQQQQASSSAWGGATAATARGAAAAATAAATASSSAWGGTTAAGGDTSTCQTPGPPPSPPLAPDYPRGLLGPGSGSGPYLLGSGIHMVGDTEPAGAAAPGGLPSWYNGPGGGAAQGQGQGWDFGGGNAGGERVPGAAAARFVQMLQQRSASAVGGSLQLRNQHPLYHPAAAASGSEGGGGGSGGTAALQRQLSASEVPAVAVAAQYSGAVVAAGVGGRHSLDLDQRRSAEGAGLMGYEVGGVWWVACLAMRSNL